MREVKIKSVVPIYIVAGVWLIYALLFPLYKLWHFVIAIAVSVISYIIASKIFKPEIIEVEEEKPKEEPVSYGEEVDAVIKEGNLAIAEMNRLRSSIDNPDIQDKITQLMQISDKIVQDAIHDPSDIPQIKRFLSYYAPTTIKLLNAYDRMSDQGVSGKNISGTMKSIEDMLDTSIAAYKKQLDSLFANQAMDIETDIDVMNAMMAREGLSGQSFNNTKKRGTN